MKPAVGFIGLGEIGMPIASRIRLADFPLVVWNRTAQKMEPLRELGAVPEVSAAGVARRSEIVCICISDSAAVEEVVFGPKGIAESASPDKLLVDHSTIHPMHTREFAQRLAKQTGMRWVDAPVSGGSVGARAGTLAAMVGGSEDDVERVRPVIMSHAGRLTHMGGVGCGQATKACNQMINVGTLAVIAEALTLASNFGLDPARLPEALAGGFAESQIMRHYAHKLVAGNYSGSTLTTLKDMEIVSDLGRLTASPMPVISLLISFYRLLVARGDTGDGMAGIMRMYADGPLAAHKQRPQSPTLRDQDRPG